MRQDEQEKRFSMTKKKDKSSKDIVKMAHLIHLGIQDLIQDYGICNAATLAGIGYSLVVHAERFKLSKESFKEFLDVIVSCYGDDQFVLVKPKKKKKNGKRR